MAPKLRKFIEYRSGLWSLMLFPCELDPHSGSQINLRNNSTCLTEIQGFPNILASHSGYRIQLFASQRVVCSLGIPLI